MQIYDYQLKPYTESKQMYTVYQIDNGQKFKRCLINVEDLRTVLETQYQREQLDLGQLEFVSMSEKKLTKAAKQIYAN